MKKLVAAALAGVMMLSVTACGAKDFDAKGYVQGVIDASYYGDYTAHAEDVGMDESELEEQFETERLDVAKQAIAMSGIPATDEELQEYVDLIEEGYKKIKFEVGEAVKDDDDNYTVEVTVTPVGILDNLESEFQTKLEEAISQNAGQDQYMKVFNESVKNSVAKAPSYDPQKVTLHVNYTEEGNTRVYTVLEEDLTNLEAIATNQQ